MKKFNNYNYDNEIMESLSYEIKKNTFTIRGYNKIKTYKIKKVQGIALEISKTIIKSENLEKYINDANTPGGVWNTWTFSVLKNLLIN